MKLLAAALFAMLLVQDPPAVAAIVDRFHKAREAAKTAADVKAAAKAAVEALDALAAQSKERKEEVAALLEAAEMCSYLDDDRGAAGRFAKIIGKYPTHEDVQHFRLLQAEALLWASDDAAAREVYSKFIKSAGGDPRLFEIEVKNAQTFIGEQKFDDALAAFNALRLGYKAKPEEWAVMLHQSKAYEFAEKIAPSRDLLEKVVKDAPETGAVEFAKRVLANQLWIGKPPPVFEEKDRNGKAFSLAETRGRVVCLYFFSVSQDPVTMLMKRLRVSNPDPNLVVMGIAIDKPGTQLEDYLKTFDVDWPICIDGGHLEGKLAKLFNLKGLPLALMIDKKGVIRFVNPIYSNTGRELKMVASRLLGEK